MLANLKVKKEAPAYPPGFLRAMQRYAYEVLRSHLERSKVSSDVTSLLDEMFIAGELEAKTVTGAKVEPVWNEQMAECVSGIALTAAKMGGEPTLAGVTFRKK